MWEKIKALSLKQKLITALSILIAASMIAAWYKPDPVPPNGGFTEPPGISGVPAPSVDVPVKKVKVIPKKAVKKVIPDLPPEVDEENTEVTATADLPPSENGTQVVTTIDTDTGVSKIITKEKPAPLFAFENKKRIGVGYGIGTHGTTAKVFSEWSFLRVGNAHVSVQGEIRATTVSSPEATASVLVDYRF